MAVLNEMEILSIKEVMAFLHIGRDKAYALMHSKSFPSTKIGKTYFVTSDNLKTWVNENAGRTIVL